MRVSRINVFPSATGASGDAAGCREEAVQNVCAPVTVKAVRAAVGPLHLARYLRSFAQEGTK